MAKKGLVPPDHITKWLFRKVLDTDLDDPYLGMGNLLLNARSGSDHRGSDDAHIAQKLLRRSSDAELRMRALALSDQVKNMRRLQERVKKVRKTLAENVNDPANISRNKGKRPSRRKSKAEPGLIGRVNIRNRVNNRAIDAGLILKYQPGKQFHHTTWQNLAAQYGIRGRRVQIELAGLLHLTKTTKISVRHKGGSPSGGVLKLYVDGHELGAVGDDRTKDTTYTITLNKGDHTVRWLLRGGHLGSNLITFHDASTQQPLAIYYTPRMLAAARSIPTKAEVDVSTE